MSNVVDLSARLALDPAARPFLILLGAAPAIAEVLEQAFPLVTKEQQRALVAVVAWRLQGAALPASIELLKRLPVMAGMHPESIQAAFHQLCDAHVLAFQAHGDEGGFAWPALDQIMHIALQEADAAKLVDTSGNRLR